MVAVGRTELTLWLSEAVSADGSTIELRATSPSPVVVPVTLSLDPSRRVARLTTAPLERGSYRLDYTLFSTDDGHTTRGAIVFGVGFRPDGVPTGSADLPPVPTVTSRWLDLGGILLGIGLLAISGRVLGSLGPEWLAPRRRVRRVGAAGLAMAALTGALTPLLATHVAGASTVDWLAATREVLVGSPWGLTWLAREVGLVAGVVLLSRHWDGRIAPRRRRLAWAVLLTVALLDALAGHAVTVDSAVVVTVLAAAATSSRPASGSAAWPCSSSACGRSCAAAPDDRAWPSARPGAPSARWLPARRWCSRRAVSTRQAGHVDGPDSLTASAYGIALLGKVLLVAIALALAGYHTLVVNDRLASRAGQRIGRGASWRPRRRPFTSTTALEAMVLVAAVGFAAVMTSVPTTKEVVAAPTRSRTGSPRPSTGPSSPSRPSTTPPVARGSSCARPR